MLTSTPKMLDFWAGSETAGGANILRRFRLYRELVNVATSGVWVK